MLPCLQEDGAVHVPLVTACTHGSLEVVKLLLEHHADVHKQYKVCRDIGMPYIYRNVPYFLE